MSPPLAPDRALTSPARAFEKSAGASATRPGHAPLATTLLLFAIVAGLLVYIAWI